MNFNKIFTAIVIVCFVSLFSFGVMWASKHVAFKNKVVVTTTPATLVSMKLSMPPSFIDVPDSAWDIELLSFDVNGVRITFEKLNDPEDFRNLKTGESVVLTYQEAYSITLIDKDEIGRCLSARNLVRISRAPQ